MLNAAKCSAINLSTLTTTPAHITVHAQHLVAGAAVAGEVEDAVPALGLGVAVVAPPAVVSFWKYIQYGVFTNWPVGILGKRTDVDM